MRNPGWNKQGKAEKMGGFEVATNEKYANKMRREAVGKCADSWTSGKRA